MMTTPTLPSSPACPTVPQPSENSEVVRVGSWNVSWWTQDRIAPIIQAGVALMAVQETKLALLPLEHARALARMLGCTLHHGHPVPAKTRGGHGDSCGVGVLAAPGVAVAALHPQGAAWRKLHTMCRLHCVVIPPRVGLPLGLRVFTVYAPLPTNSLCAAFTSAFGDMVAVLDLQIPTLLLGDFNGSVSPQRDYGSGRGEVSPLLASLVGPAGPFLDLQLVVSPA